MGQRELGPSETRVRHEDEFRHCVETAPHGIFQDLELIHVDVYNGSAGTLSSSVQKDVRLINQQGWKSQEMLHSICTAALEGVNGHECEQHQTRNGPIQLDVPQPKTTSDPKFVSMPRGSLVKRSATRAPRHNCPEIRILSNTNGRCLAHPRYACVMKMSTAMT